MFRIAVCSRRRYRSAALASAIAIALGLGACTPAAKSAGQAQALQQRATAVPAQVTAQGEPSSPSGETADGQDLGARASNDGAVRTTVAPPSGPGDLSIVAVEPQATLEPVAVGKEVGFANDLSLDVDLGKVDVASGRPGEIGGTALTVTVLVRNQGSVRSDVSTVFVTVEDAEGTPLSPLYGDPYSPVQGHLEPQGSTEGTYVFTLADLTQPFTVRVSAAAEVPAAVFVGSL